MTKWNFLAGFLILIAIFSISIFLRKSDTPKPPLPVACTEEAKLCPDGSAVGRTGSNCEFSPCPTPVATSTNTSTSTNTNTNTIAIGANTTIGDTTIGVLDLVEDSRCPVDVQCIQVGTVRVRASINSFDRDFTFTLKQPQVVGGVTITLVSVVPEQKYSTQNISPSDYRFAFSVVPISIPAKVSSGIRGSVHLGPTCPVMRDPPETTCADKPYETTILVRKSGADTVVATTKSDVSGQFEIALPPGAYTISNKVENIFPRCSPVDVVVKEGGYTEANISCDTGIR